MAGPKIPWRPGRIDGFVNDATPDGRLPDGAQGAPHLRDVSLQRLSTITLCSPRSYPPRSSTAWGAYYLIFHGQLGLNGGVGQF